MRFPIKLNKTYWPKFYTNHLPSANDPRILILEQVSELDFSEAVSAFKFGTTFKSTQKKRFPLSILEITNLVYSCKPTVIDVGASDGITSMDVMKSLPFEKYYVTDLNTDVYYQVKKEITWFYDDKGECILMATDKWVNYPDTGGAIFPFNLIAHTLFSQAPKVNENATRIKLINPSLLSAITGNVSIERYSILDAWPHERVDLIIAANILNRGYFTASEIEKALKRLVGALKDNGRIVIIDNRTVEKSTIFQFKSDNVNIEKRVNGGTEIEALAMNIFSTLQK
jgi:hypothetical protein